MYNELSEKNIDDLNQLLTERLDRLAQLKLRLAYLKLYECGIRKSTGECVYFKYFINSDATASIEVYVPRYSSTYKITLDEWSQDYVEYTPTNKMLFPRL